MLHRRSALLGAAAGLAPIKLIAQPAPNEDLVREFLRQGQWSTTADDNATGESLTQDFLRRLVVNQDPDTPSGRTSLGLFALALGVAEWGVASPDALPADPNGTHWRSDTGDDSGKHLMSYTVGGIGISHADVGDLVQFVTFVAEKFVPEGQRAELLAVIDSTRYPDKKVQYDYIRAAGECHNPKYADLDGKEDFPNRHVATQCDKYGSSGLRPRDWQVFRHWMRVAMRTEEGQRWLLELWLKKYWDPTLKRVPQGDGRVEEALVNVRVRNSSPALANAAVNRKATSVSERVQRELDEYRSLSGGRTLQRRCGIMLRPVVLYRACMNLDQLSGIYCPPRR